MHLRNIKRAARKGAFRGFGDKSTEQRTSSPMFNFKINRIADRFLCDCRILNVLQLFIRLDFLFPSRRIAFQNNHEQLCKSVEDFSSRFSCLFIIQLSIVTFFCVAVENTKKTDEKLREKMLISRRADEGRVGLNWMAEHRNASSSLSQSVSRINLI